MTDSDKAALPSLAPQLTGPMVPANIGLIRLNWSPCNPVSRLTFVLSVRGTDCADVVAEAVSLIKGQPIQRIDSKEKQAIKIVAGICKSQTLGVIRLDITKPLIRKLSNTRNTTAIFVLEDPAVLAINMEHQSSAPDVRASLRSSAMSAAEAIAWASDLRIPLMCLSASRARAFPDLVVREIATFLNTEPSEAILGVAMQYIDDRGPRRSRVLEKINQVKGHLDRLQQPGAIRGWARRTMSEERLHIVVRKDGIEIAEGVADLVRQDLIRNNIGDGYHGFDIRLPQLLSDENQRFEVIVPRFEAVIGYVEMSASKASVVN